MLKTEIGYNELRIYLKNCLGFRFKRGSSRAAWSMKKELKYLQAIFSWRILSDLYTNRLVVNVDESSFGRSIKANYSWLPKGSTYPIINTNWEGRVNLIFGLFSNGRWIAIIQDEIGTEKTFQIFLIFLKKYVDSWHEDNGKPLRVILDNASIHLTESVQKMAQIVSIELNFLPPYSPNLAPVEMIFGVIKRKLLSTKWKEKISFSKPSGRRTLVDILKTLSHDSLIRMWFHLIWEARKVMLDTY